MKFLNNILQQFIANPKRLLLADSIGAATTAVLLFVLLKTNTELFGIPPTVLNYLSAIAVIFSLYSLIGSFATPSKFKTVLRIIATANLSYCILTWALLIANQNSITPLTVAYFFGETLIILTLVYAEFTVANAQQTTKK